MFFTVSGVFRTHITRAIPKSNIGPCLSGMMPNIHFTTTTKEWPDMNLIEKEYDDNRDNLPEQKMKLDSHWLSRMVPSWKSTADLYQQLDQNIFYEDDHVIAFNKPVNLQANSYGDTCIRSYLESLKESRRVEVMQRMFSPNKLYSGITVVAKTKRAVEILTKYFSHCQSNNIFCHKYRAITLGVPYPMSSSDLFGVEHRDKKGEVYKVTVATKETKLTKKYKGLSHGSNRAIIPIKMKTIEYNNIDNTCSVALVELATRKVKWDSLQVYLLNKFCPILGDHMYSGCLHHILGKPVLLEFYKHDHAHSTQELPSPISENLDLTSDKQHRQLPLFIHCSQLTIPKIHSITGHAKSPKITLECPMPPYFSEALSRLGLV